MPRLRPRLPWIHWLVAGHSASDIGKPAEELVFDSRAEEQSEKAMTLLLNYAAKARTLLGFFGFASSRPAHGGREASGEISLPHLQV